MVVKKENNLVNNEGGGVISYGAMQLPTDAKAFAIWPTLNWETV